MSVRPPAYEKHATLPASLEAAEALFQEVRSTLTSLLQPAESFAVELLLREALTNAVLHGSGADPLKHVHCALRYRPGRFFIAVRDEGRGFDWRATWLRSPAPFDCSGRGIEIFRQFANRLRFSDSGQQIFLYKKLPQGGPDDQYDDSFRSR